MIDLIIAFTAGFMCAAIGMGSLCEKLISEQEKLISQMMAYIKKLTGETK